MSHKVTKFSGLFQRKVLKDQCFFLTLLLLFFPILFVTLHQQNNKTLNIMTKTELKNFYCRSYAEQIADLFSSLSCVPIEDIKENMENGERKCCNLAEFGQIAWDDADRKCISSSNAATFSVAFVSQN